MSVADGLGRISVRFSRKNEWIEFDKTLHKNLADVPWRNLGLLPFQLFHRFKMEVVSMTSLSSGIIVLDVLSFQ